MKKLIVLTMALYSYLSVAQTVVFEDDLNSYPVPNQIYGCDFHNHYNITQMNNVWGSWLGSVSYLDEFGMFSPTNTASFEDGKGFVLRSCGASQTEGTFLNVPNGIESNTCYDITFDLAYFTHFTINSSTDDLVFRVALGNDWQDTQFADLDDCCSDYPDENSICIIEDIVIGELETVNTNNTWKQTANFHTVTVTVNVPNNYSQLLFYPLDTQPSSAGGTPIFGVMFDNIKIEKFCNNGDLNYVNQIPKGKHQARTITVTSSPNLTYSDFFNTSEYIAIENVDLLPSTNYVIFNNNEFFEARIEPCLNPGYCNSSWNSCNNNNNSFETFDFNEREALSELDAIENSKKDYSIAIFPNPTYNLVTISNRNSSNYLVELYDLSGILLKKELSHYNDYSLDMSRYPKGLYFIKIFDESQQKFTFRKVIKK